MPVYTVNEDAVRHAKRLIDGRQYCHYRAAEWRHKEIELAAHELLQYLDRKSASRRGGKPLERPED